MEFHIENGNLEKHKSNCIIVGIFESFCLSEIAKKIDQISNGYISSLLKYGELEGKIGQVCLLHHVPNVLSERVLLIGCGKKCEFNEIKYKKIIQKSINVINDTNIIEMMCFLTELHVQKRNTYWKVRQAVEVIKETTYDFNQFKTKKSNLYRSLKKVTFSVSTHHEIIVGKSAIRHGLAISDGIKSAKDLGNMPPNICNSTYLSSKVLQLVNLFKKNISAKIIDKKQMNELGMHSYLAVSNGSKNEPTMSIIKYKGDSSKNVHPIVLIGKGLTFDSGGLSIKSSKRMDEMKYDMCGAAAIYGVMQVVADLQLPLNVIGVLAGCENMPSGQAYRPGDILTTMSGQTVEILNTDAEGRLVLCDVFTYVKRFNPEVVIDVATLTGACIIALGHHITGLISNHDLLANELISASEQSSDPVWRLPLDDNFQKQLKSHFADMINTGGQSGGAIIAGCFLSRFANKYNWAHLDIAGTAWNSCVKKCATGRPVAMLSQFLLNRAGLTTEMNSSI